MQLVDGAGQGKPSGMSVTEAVRMADASVRALGKIVVTGEVAGYKGMHRNGHCYFSLRDDEYTMDVTIWHNIFVSRGFELAEGMLIQATGSFDVYKNGRLSFKASHVEVAGEGALRLAVDQLARKLAAEGLMDPARKRPIPALCERICMVTSVSGSVREDVCQTLQRRNPLVQIDIVGCAVQGEAAPPTIIRALEYAASTRPDAILLVRGGGSFEDLMCFNDEALARAIAACPVPVITGIGHEPDNSIADMVADMRAATPTAAAELVAPHRDDMLAELASSGERMRRALASKANVVAQGLSGQHARLVQAVRGQIERRRTWVHAISGRPSLTNPVYLLDRRKEDAAQAERRLLDAQDRLLARRRDACAALQTQVRSAASRICVPHQSSLGRLAAALDALSPLRVLGRGYAIARDGQGHVVSDAEAVSAGDELEVLLGRGSIITQVSKTIPAGDEPGGSIRS